MKPLVLSNYTLTSCLGLGLEKTRSALSNAITGLRPYDFDQSELNMMIGRVAELEDVILPNALQAYDCRNIRLAHIALQQDQFLTHIANAKQKYKAHRIALFIGTSTSGVHATELAYRQDTNQLPTNYHYNETHDNAAILTYIQQLLGITGPGFVVSTACSSSAKVFANASRFINSGLCDAAIVGGVDSLCYTTLYGFSALELISPTYCQPADKNRQGISIGEAAGFALLEPSNTIENQQISLLSYGESSDGYHMATPHPQGKGMHQAMTAALHRGKLQADDIDYINCHGTATQTNDLAESQAIMDTFTHPVACSSTKGWTGHTLGAAGITEAIISALCLEMQWLPQSLNTEIVDAKIQCNILLKSQFQPVSRIMTNAFGFGGNNCSLILGRT